eukprot:TRINITY_DN52201_c0_g1_i3.p1 TRINITY_DN52201_c0_g1~~TRINITY_DN52201_c0_g1_i3.p1  ORF type:complete len:355 (+),score=-15.41 TRINITY_DN52201_c0_g1_i3:18-1082(+)
MAWLTWRSFWTADTVIILVSTLISIALGGLSFGEDWGKVFGVIGIVWSVVTGVFSLLYSAKSNHHRQFIREEQGGNHQPFSIFPGWRPFGLHIGYLSSCYVDPQVQHGQFIITDNPGLVAPIVPTPAPTPTGLWRVFEPVYYFRHPTVPTPPPLQLSVDFGGLSFVFNHAVRGIPDPTLPTILNFKPRFSKDKGSGSISGTRLISTSFVGIGRTTVHYAPDIPHNIIGYDILDCLELGYRKVAWLNGMEIQSAKLFRDNPTPKPLAAMYCPSEKPDGEWEPVDLGSFYDSDAIPEFQATHKVEVWEISQSKKQKHFVSLNKNNAVAGAVPLRGTSTIASNGWLCLIPSHHKKNA